MQSLALDKVSGKIRCTLGTKELSILWDDDPVVWNGNLPLSYLFPFVIPFKPRSSFFSLIDSLKSILLSV